MSDTLNGSQEATQIFGQSAKLISFEDDVRIAGELQSASMFGATLRIFDDQDIPKRLSILVPRLRLNVGCKVIWRHRNDVAVLFDRKVELAGAV